ncbi:MAG TPA: hypothetical protein VJT73_10730 [Polyangiaceae bacterium]|nr:hypothetical protein [Polyangiaceae bacterium]
MTESRPPGASDEATMAVMQGATPPAWLGRSRWSLLADVAGSVRQNVHKVVQVVMLVLAFFRPRLVRRRLERLRDLGHVEAMPTIAQLLVAGRDQMMVSASEETKLFYRSQGIPWIFHNVRRFLSGPATMLDPIGLFSPRQVIIEHVLQTFHRHPLYDLVLLRAHERGVEEMAREADQLLHGTHPHQRALASLVEDGTYHSRLPGEIRAFMADPHLAARPVPPSLVDDPAMMTAMDQFKDIAGYTRYAARLPVGVGDAALAWLLVAFDETLGALLGQKLGPRRVRLDACDPDIVERYMRTPKVPS